MIGRRLQLGYQVGLAIACRPGSSGNGFLRGLHASRAAFLSTHSVTSTKNAENSGEVELYRHSRMNGTRSLMSFCSVFVLLCAGEAVLVNTFPLTWELLSSSASLMQAIQLINPYLQALCGVGVILNAAAVTRSTVYRCHLSPNGNKLGFQLHNSLGSPGPIQVVDASKVQFFSEQDKMLAKAISSGTLTGFRQRLVGFLHHYSVAIRPSPDNPERKLYLSTAGIRNNKHDLVSLLLNNAEAAGSDMTQVVDNSSEDNQKQK